MSVLIYFVNLIYIIKIRLRFVVPIRLLKEKHIYVLVNCFNEFY